MTRAARWFLMRRAILAIAAVFVVAPAFSEETEDDDLLNFVVGDYAVVGRESDGTPYGGSARISFAEGSSSVLLLEQRRAGQQIMATGRLEVPSPPGEGKVLRFRWRASAPMVMTCLVGSDLDNYARLTCVWLTEGSKPEQPGLEAMFPTATWPTGNSSP